VDDVEPEKWIGALDSVTWYNGLAETVLTWLNLEPVVPDSYITPMLNYGLADDEDTDAYYQLQVLWMIAVELFGDCGTSPRYGWITDIDGFNKWVLDITKTYRESKENEE
jgi:hypothetical protein